MQPNKVAESLVQTAAQKNEKASDVGVDARAVKCAQVQDHLLQVLQKEGLIDQAAGTVSAHLIVEALLGTALPFAILAQIDEDTLIANMRALYRQVRAAAAGEEASSLIIPGRA